MGWTRHELPKRGWTLFTRAGIEGVYIQKHDKEGGILSDQIEIPPEMIIMLMADTIRSKKISELEQMEDKEILRLQNPAKV